MEKWYKFQPQTWQGGYLIRIEIDWHFEFDHLTNVHFTDQNFTLQKMVYKVHACYMKKLYIVVINSYHQEVTFVQVLTRQEFWLEEDISRFTSNSNLHQWWIHLDKRWRLADFKLQTCLACILHTVL